MKVIEMDIMKVTKGQNGGKAVTFTKEALKEVYENFISNVRYNLANAELAEGIANGPPRSVPCFATHEHGDSGRALGHIVALKPAEGFDKITAIIELTPLGQERLGDHEYTDCSVELFEDENYGWLLTGLAFTNEPALNLSPLKVLASKKLLARRLETMGYTADVIKQYLTEQGKPEIFEEVMNKLMALAPGEVWSAEQVLAILSEYGLVEALPEATQAGKEPPKAGGDTSGKTITVPPGTTGKVQFNFEKQAKELQGKIATLKLEISNQKLVADKEKKQLELSILEERQKTLELEKKQVELERKVRKTELEKQTAPYVATDTVAGLLTPELAEKVVELRLELEPEQDKQFMLILSKLPKVLPKMLQFSAKGGQGGSDAQKILDLAKDMQSKDGSKKSWDYYFAEATKKVTNGK